MDGHWTATFYSKAACSQNVSLLLHEVVAIRQPLTESDSAEGHFTNSRRGVRVVNLHVQSGYQVSHSLGRDLY